MVDRPDTFIGAALNETVEEMTEEATEDSMMILGAMASALGITRKIDYNVDLGEVLSRYAMAGIGGFMGGGLHHLNLPWNKIHGSFHKDDSDRKLIDLIVNYGADEVLDGIEREFKAGKLAGSKELSTKFDERTKTENSVNFLSANTIEESQAFAIKENLKDLVKMYDSILENNGFGNMEEDMRATFRLNEFPELEGIYNLGIENNIRDHLKYYNYEVINLNAKLAEMTQDDPNRALVES
jgi:hypothetical protein